MKKPEYAPPKSPRSSNQVDPLQLLDYRCHLPPGQTSLGTHYPKPVSGGGGGGGFGGGGGLGVVVGVCLVFRGVCLGEGRDTGWAAGVLVGAHDR